MNFIIERLIYFLPGILIGLTVHEFCHAFAAYKLGDHTSREMGRLTFNPIKHIDPIGLLFIIIAGFGWAKPVQFNPQNLSNVRRDKAIIAAAGPLSNLLLAIIFSGIIRLWFLLLSHLLSNGNFEFVYNIMYSGFMIGLLTMLQYIVMINLGLFVFNLIPIPPLDGSHIVFSGLNLSPETEYRIMKIGTPLLFIIIIVQSQTNITILPIGNLVSLMMNFLMPF